MLHLCPKKSLAFVALVLSASAATLANVTITDDFTGNSGGVPAGWTNLNLDGTPTSTIVESGTVVTITDPRGNGGPTLMSNNTALGTLSDFTLAVDLASTTSNSGSQPRALVGIGGLGTGVILFEFNALTMTFKSEVIFGGNNAAFAFPAGPNAPAYTNGAISFNVIADDDSFRMTSLANGFDSGDILYSSAGLAGFDSLDDLGSSPALLLGTESDGNVPNGTLSTVAFDRVSLTGVSSLDNSVPEPVSTLSLFGCAGLGLALVQRRRAGRLGGAGSVMVDLFPRGLAFSLIFNLTRSLM